MTGTLAKRTSEKTKDSEGVFRKMTNAMLAHFKKNHGKDPVLYGKIERAVLEFHEFCQLDALEKIKGERELMAYFRKMGAKVANNTKKDPAGSLQQQSGGGLKETWAKLNKYRRHMTTILFIVALGVWICAGAQMLGVVSGDIVFDLNICVLRYFKNTFEWASGVNMATNYWTSAGYSFVRGGINLMKSGIKSYYNILDATLTGSEFAMASMIFFVCFENSLNFFIGILRSIYGVTKTYLKSITTGTQKLYEKNKEGFKYLCKQISLCIIQEMLFAIARIIGSHLVNIVWIRLKKKHNELTDKDDDSDKNKEKNKDQNKKN